MPVPQSWYATNPNSNSPVAINVLPMPPTHHRQSCGGAGLSNLRTRAGRVGDHAASDTLLKLPAWRYEQIAATAS